MPKFLKSLAVLLALPLLLVGCKINSINYFPPTPAHIRVVNVLGTAAPIDVIANGVTVWSSLGFEAMTSYVDFDNVTTKVQVKLSGSNEVLIENSYNPAGDESYTFVVFGTTLIPSLGVMADVNQAPPSGKFALNVFNAAPIGNGAAVGTIPVDLYLTAPGAPIETASPTFTYISFSNGNIFGQYDAGQYQLRLTVAGTKVIVYDSGTLTLNPQTATDLILYSRGSEILPNVLLNDSDGAGLQRIANNLLARIKVVNGAFQTGPVDQLLNDKAIVSNLAYNTASLYNVIAAGPGTITFQATAAPGATIATLANTFAGATDQTVFITGFAGSTKAVALLDNNLPPGPSSAAIRYVNASPDAGTLDAYANDVLQASSIATNTASAYVQIVSSTFALTFKDHATGQTVLALPGIGFNTGQTYSVYVVGPAGSLAGLATADTP